MSFSYSPDIEDYLEQKQMADEERLEREHDEAYEQWVEDMVTYAAEVVPRHALDWAMYALELAAGNLDAKEPVLPPAPIRPDLIPSEPVDPNAEIPF